MHWLLTEGDFASSRRRLAIFGNIFACDNPDGSEKGAPGIWLVNTRDTAKKHPAVHRIGPHNEELSGLDWQLCYCCKILHQWVLCFSTPWGIVIK